MVQSIDAYSLQNIPNRINWRRSQNSILCIKFSGFFRQRAIYETPLKVSMKVQRIAGAFSRISIQNVNHLLVYFCGIRIIFDFFFFLTEGHDTMFVAPVRVHRKFHISMYFLKKIAFTFLPRKNYVFGKKPPFFQIIQERSCPSSIPFEKTIFSEHLKKISYLRVFF